MPRITGCTADGIDNTCTDCLFENDIDGCKMHCSVYNTKEVWSDD
jgi:hypothetical protein